MLNRISVNALLKSVIATLAVAVVIALSLSAWSSWSRLEAVNRISIVADASGDLFMALHNLRTDRSGTLRDLNADQPTEMAPSFKENRRADMQALKSALATLALADFPERQAAVASLSQAITKLTALHQETTAAFAQPKSGRRQRLAEEYSKVCNARTDGAARAHIDAAHLFSET
jgi:methyl-accepting chemotaxis protein